MSHTENATHNQNIVMLGSHTDSTTRWRTRAIWTGEMIRPRGGVKEPWWGTLSNSSSAPSRVGISIQAYYNKIQIKGFYFRYDSSWWRNWWCHKTAIIYCDFRFVFSTSGQRMDLTIKMIVRKRKIFLFICIEQILIFDQKILKVANKNIAPISWLVRV